MEPFYYSSENIKRELKARDRKKELKDEAEFKRELKEAKTQEECQYHRKK